MSALDVQVGGDHYKKYKIQPMEYSMANGLDACQHTAIKYITRFRDKGGIADLEKAKHCIDLLIEFERKSEQARAGLPEGFVEFVIGNDGPTVGTIVDVLYVDNQVEEKKIVGQFSWNEVRAYKVRLATPPPLPDFAIPEELKPARERRWEVGTRLRRTYPTSKWFTEGQEYEIAELSEGCIWLIDDTENRHSWTEKEARNRFIRA